ncbi:MULTISPECIES: diacylglycerol/lipid kinase family protein [Halomonas]|uniref:Diacylglycerol kinase-like protein n=1 Tax=Halomonas ventosae TaxID=229007 RepID=A0A4R6HH74_9GAMM|nr:diacylglycerol kinase family protein [Halomonas ventosae]TDO07744.1 diacylglycerol kinase-like protein [Halomonas ventosae]
MAAWQAAPPRRLGVVCNRRSGRCRRHLERIRRQAAACAALDYREVEDLDGIHAALGDFVAARVEAIAVVGGDGTLQATLTALLTGHDLTAETLPALIAIAGGTTNMSARSLGARLAPWAALEQLVAWCEGRGEGPRQVPHPVVRVAPGTAPVQYGLFFGAGAITAGVAYFHARLQSRLASAWGPRLAFVRMLWSILRGKPHPLLPPTPCRLEFDDGTRQEGAYQIVAISTLDRLMMGARPFWGAQPGALRLAAMARDAAAPWRWLPLVLCGYGQRVAPRAQGYFSRNLGALTLICESDFIIDGERFTAGCGRPLRITASRPLPFHVL